MKQVLTGFLTAVLILAAALVPAYGADAGAFPGGKLEVVVRADYRDTAAALERHALTLTLTGDKTGSQQFALRGSEGQETFSCGQNTARLVLSLRNPQDAPLGGNDQVGFLLVSFSGLPMDQEYQVSLAGKGFASFTSPKMAVDVCTPHLLVSGDSGGFALGDLTGDGEITQADLDQVLAALGSSSAGGDLDLDGKVDITDLALVHRNMGARRPAEVYGGALVTDGLLDLTATAQDLSQAKMTLEGGSVNDLFEDNGTKVRLVNGGDGPCQIPVTLAAPKEMSVLSIVSPATNGALEAGKVLVEYENGSSEEIAFDNTPPAGTHATERHLGQSTVTIPLGKREPVKKITITVEKVFGADGRVSYAVIEKIEFLRDIIPDNLDFSASIPKNLTAAAGNHQVTLSWRGVDNVDGYLVRYGESSSALTRQLRVGETQAVVSGLENLKTYYFTVAAYNGDWTGKDSAPVSCVPQPSKAPLPPDNLSLSPEESAITASWKKTEDAEFYNLYYKESSAKDFILAVEKHTATSFTVTGLTNDVFYDFYVVAGNQIGLSRPSLIATGKPEKEILNFPTLPTMNRIPSSAIIKAEMTNPNNVAPEYGGKFNVKQVYDGDFETHWTALKWSLSSRFTFEFDEEQSMDYLIYVPRLNKGYPNVLERYSVTVWDKDGNETHLTSDQGMLNNLSDQYVGTAPIVRNNPGQTGYAILPFTRNDHIKKISVLVRQGDGTRKPCSLSEIAFYTYDDADSSIAALFTDGSYTQLASGVTQGRIDELRARIQQTDGYYVNQTILLDELDLAEALLKGDTSRLGAVMDKVQSRDASADPKRISTLQPVGVTAEAGKQLVVYASIPQGETVELIPTQHFAEAAKWSGSPIRLENGRNIITIPRLNDVSPQRGGSLYLQYSGSRAGEIRLQVRGGTKIPLLELSDWHQLDESAIRSRISAYIEELDRYCTTTLGGMNSDVLPTHFLNATEISFPHVLLSLPATQVRSGLGSSDRTEALYHDGLAWEELMQLMYRTHGIDLDALESSHSRHNIRYMRMFGNAFMYAGGSHIGIGYGSCSGMVAGRPTSVTGAGNANGLFGWGIQHEIGHVMDTLGKAEITNNIYSLFAQTWDNGSNALPSRLENSNKYEGIYQKVTSGQQGMSNDVFVSLGMYWQLHLAYDGPEDNFYNRLNKVYKGGGDDGFMAAASQIAGRDLSGFFSSWGFTPSGQSGPQEERKLQYLTDQSRRERLAGTQRQSGTVGIAAQYDREARQATVTVTPVQGANMLGYEISRTLNDTTQPVAFLSAKSGATTWNDTLGSVNNKAVSYTVKAVDILGYVIAQADSSQLDISHDNLIPTDVYTWSAETAQGGLLTAQFPGDRPVAGIRFDLPPAEETRVMDSGEPPAETFSFGSEGTVTVEVSLDGAAFTTVRTISYSELRDNPGRLFFFTRTEADGSICPFDAALVRVSGLPEGLSASAIRFAAYPGDHLAFGENGIGILAKDYGEIPAGTLIITGSFRGNPVFNTLRVYGRSQAGDIASGELAEGDRVPMEGEVYLFAALPESGDMGEIDNGLWVFVPKQQQDASGENGCVTSLLPTQIMAELHRTDIPEGGAGRITSSTRWLPSPTYSSMPKIILEE
ncbi:MAG: hypothetical protein HFF13_06115 [Angelakisella sp.]|nr:hypothetical protein [Angelakisella sp.]